MSFQLPPHQLRAVIWVTRAFLAFACLLFAYLAVSQGPPTSPDGPGLERDIQYGFLVIGLLGAFIAWFRILPGGMLLLFTGIALGVAAAGRYSEATALGVALMSPELAHHAALKAQNSSDFSLALAHNLAWPWVDSPLLSVVMWLPLIAGTLTDTSVPQLYGGTTLVVQAVDLGFLVPLGLFTAVTVYRRLPVGHLLSAVVIVKGASIALGIVAMLVVEWLTTGEPQLPPIVLFGLTSLAGLAIAIRIYRGIEAEPGPAGASAAKPVAA